MQSGSPARQLWEAPPGKQIKMRKYCAKQVPKHVSHEHDKKQASKHINSIWSSVLAVTVGLLQGMSRNFERYLPSDNLVLK